MLDYETLDLIADSYVPVLIILSLASLSKTAILSRWRLFRVHAAAMSLGLLISYGLMFVDAQLQLWSILGLDYSTHTAVSLVMVIFLIIAMKKYSYVWGGSLVCYILLMLYQGYHSIADVFTTACVVGLLLLPIVLLIFRRWGAETNNQFHSTQKDVR